MRWSPSGELATGPAICCDAAVPLRNALARISLTAALVVAWGAGSAAAKPVVPGASPLWIDGDGEELISTCPQAAAVDGRQPLRVVNSIRSEFARGLAFVYLLSSPPPIVHWCDPEAVAARRFAPPITGELATETTDGVFWGQRYLSGEPVDGRPDGLRVGDSLSFPAGSPSTVLDLAVATGSTGTRTLRIPPAPSAPARLRVEGDAGAPTVVVTGLDGTERRVPVDPVPAARFGAQMQRRGGTVSMRVTAPPQTIVLVTGLGDPPVQLLGRSGTRTFSRRTATDRRVRVEVYLVDLLGRREFVRRCTLAARARRASCPAKPRSVAGLRDTPLPGRFDRAQASRAAAAMQPALGGWAARALRRADAPVAQGTVTPVGRNRNGFETLAPGDLNGDDIPDFVRLLPSGEGFDAGLRVSAGGGRWQNVTVRGAAFSDRLVLPDLDGDGRAELTTDDGVIVTDAFAAGTPKRIDLGRRRKLSPRDLVPPPETGLNAFSFATLSAPIGAAADATGDGRPELVIGDGPAVVMPSEAYPPGREALLARVWPIFDWKLADWDEQELSRGSSDTVFQEAKSTLAPLVIGGRLYSASPRNRRAVSATPQTIDLIERRADGTIASSRSFLAAGWPKLIDVDPASGDALVLLVGSKACSSRTFRLNGCRAVLLRVAGSGAITSEISIIRDADSAGGAAFTNDGPDPDTGLEAIIATGDGLNPAPLRLWPSTRTGATPVDGLPVLSLGPTRQADSATALEHVVLPNGSRWVSTLTSPTVDSDSEPIIQETLLLGP